MLWLQPKDRAHLSNLINKNSLDIWDKFRGSRNLQSPHNPLLSFLRNPAFYPAWESPLSFTAWSNADLFRLHKLVSTNAIHTFPTLCKTFELPRTEFFHYLQVKNFYMPFLITGSQINQMSQFKCICKSDPHIRGLISLLYQHLNALPNEALPSYTTKWTQYTHIRDRDRRLVQYMASHQILLPKLLGTRDQLQNSSMMVSSNS